MRSTNANGSRMFKLTPIHGFTAGLVAFAFLCVGGDLAQAQNDAKSTPYQPFRISRETTRITGPIDADGLMDYAAALDAHYSQGVTVENNALIPLLGIMSNEDGREYLNRLGLREPPARVHLFEESPFDWSEREANERFRQELELAAARPWTSQDLPRIAAWLKRNELALEAILDASQRPRFFEPTIPDSIRVTYPEGPVDEKLGIVSASQFGHTFLLQCVRALRARSLLNAGSENAAAAATDILAAFRLSRLAGQRPDFIGLSIAYRNEIGCYRSLREIVLQTAVSDLWLNNIQTELDRLPEMIPLAERVDMAERYKFLDTTQRVYRGGGLLLRAVNDLSDARDQLENRLPRTAYVVAYQTPRNRWDGWRRRLTPETVSLRLTNWNKVLQDGNDWHDRVAAANRIAAPREHLAATDQLTHEWGRCRLEPTIAREEYVNHPLVRIHSVLGALPFGGGLTDVVTALPIHLPLARKYCTQGTYGVCVWLAGVRPDWGPRTIYRFQTQQRLTVVTLGLKKYHNRFQRYPAMLSDLVPDFLARVPTEVYDEARDFMYESDSRHFTLTSVGANGVLDEPRLPMLEKDDIVLSSLRRDGN